MCQLSREEKRCIRKRDAKRIKLTGKCSLCGEETITSRHHIFYDPIKFNRAVVIEVCDTCHCKIHKRDQNDNWVAKLKSIRSIELVRNDENSEEYIVMVENKVVGKAQVTLNGIKLIIVDN